jgi:hypothetical protein
MSDYRIQFQSEEGWGKNQYRRETDMAKCLSCGERKGNRFCVALSGSICSLCCGTKREKEISCFEACDYLKKGKDYQQDREISRRINSDLHGESEDIFQMEDAAGFVMPIERFFVDRYYRDRNVSDTTLYEALTKIYAFQNGMLPALKGENKAEEAIFEKYKEMDLKNPRLPDRLKVRSILRIISSIRASSGGVLGNRNYLEMIYSQHTGKGKWAGLFEKLESDE